MNKLSCEDDYGSSYPPNSDGHVTDTKNDESDEVFLSKAVRLTYDNLDQAYDQKDEAQQSSNHDTAEATNLSIESIVALDPNANKQLVTQFIRGYRRVHFVEPDWPIKKQDDDTNSSSSLQSESGAENRKCPECQKAEFDVCVNVAAILFDLFNVPFATARKGATVLINAMPWDAKVKLANIAEEHFTDPGNVIKIAKGINIISEMIIATFGDIGTVIFVAFHDLSRKDYAIIAANTAISISLLFASGGTALIIRLGLKTKAIYGIAKSVVILKKERSRHAKKRKDDGEQTALDVSEQSTRRPFARLKKVFHDRVVSVLEESAISISKNDSPKKDELSKQQGEKEQALPTTK